jgi:hypothetical protein
MLPTEATAPCTIRMPVFSGTRIGGIQGARHARQVGSPTLYAAELVSSPNTLPQSSTAPAVPPPVGVMRAP